VSCFQSLTSKSYLRIQSSTEIEYNNNYYDNIFIESRVNFHFILTTISVDITYIPKIQQHKIYYYSPLKQTSIYLV
jgi:hypothetical protein